MARGSYGLGLAKRSRILQVALMFGVIGNGLRWVATWGYYVCLTCFIGSTLGLVTHLLFAAIFEEGPDWGLYAAWGVTRGLKYAGVWAGGLALVLCVMRARREYLAKHGEGGE